MKKITLSVPDELFLKIITLYPENYRKNIVDFLNKNLGREDIEFEGIDHKIEEFEVFLKIAEQRHQEKLNILSGKDD